MNVQTYINEGAGRFSGYQPGDRLVKGPVVVVEVGDPAHFTNQDMTIAEVVWVVGNRMGRDSTGALWPHDVRSLSVGDVIVIGEAGYQCDSAGWSPIEVDDLLRSIALDSIEHPGMASARRMRAGR